MLTTNNKSDKTGVEALNNTTSLIDLRERIELKILAHEAQMDFIHNDRYPRYVVVADNNSELTQDPMMYCVKKEGDNGVVDYNQHYHPFTFRTDAEYTRDNFKASNGRGQLVWYLVTEKCYLKHCLKQNRMKLSLLRELALTQS